MKEAPKLWSKHCAKVLKKLGMKQSKHDECLWHGIDAMVVQCVDDCGISAPTREKIDQFVQRSRLIEVEAHLEEGARKAIKQSGQFSFSLIL